MTSLKYNRITTAEKLLLLGIFLTNIGNAIHILCLARFLFNSTGSSLIFGGTIVFEQIFAVGLSLIAGPFVDRSCPLKTVIFSDFVRGLLVCLIALVLLQKSSIVFICIMVTCIQMGKPFYKSGIFSSEIILIPEERRPDYNSLSASISQAGNFVGMAIAGFIISTMDSRWGLFMNGVSYLLSAMTVYFASKVARPNTLLLSSEKFSKNEKRLPQSSHIHRFTVDWMEAIIIIKKNLKLIPAFLIAGLDIALPQVFNVLLIPLVATKLNNTSFWISFLDSCFALGAIISGLIVGKFMMRKTIKFGAISGIGIQGLGFLITTFFNHPSILILACFLNGMGNTTSWSAWQTWMQSNIPGKERGRLTVIRHMSSSLVTAGCVTLVSLGEHNSYFYGALLAAIIPFLSILGIISFFQISISSYFRQNSFTRGVLWK